MKKRIFKRTTKQNILVAFVSIIVVCIIFLVTMWQFKRTYQKQIHSLETEINENVRTVYVAKENISAGDRIQKENLELVQVYSDLPSDYFITKKEFGKLAIVNIQPKSHILKDMVAENEIEDGLREEELNVLFLSSNLKENDFVDVRIIYPNGEDYVVLSKKATKNLQLENGRCYMWLDAGEIATISSAIVDAYLHEGSRLYTVKYIEPTIQEKSIVTYMPNQDVIQQMLNDKNLLDIATDNLLQKVRAELDKRLTEYEAKHQGVVTWEQKFDPTQSQVIENSSESQVIEENETTQQQGNKEETNDTEEGEKVEYVD